MKYWISPSNMERGQESLFTTPVEEALATLKVSPDDCKRWKGIGWLSFDVTQHETLQPALEAELEFIAAIARSGLNDALISKLLESLDRPYRYDPRRVAYSFRDGWVQCPWEDDPHDVIEENIHDWLSHLLNEEETDRLRVLRDKIQSLLGESDDDED